MVVVFSSCFYVVLTTRGRKISTSRCFYLVLQSHEPTVYKRRLVLSLNLLPMFSSVVHPENVLKPLLMPLEVVLLLEPVVVLLLPPVVVQLYQ